MSSLINVKSKTRIYRILEGDLQSGSPLKLEMILETDSVSEARSWLKSRECFMDQIKNRNISQAEFLIIPEKDHYRLMPVTVVIAQNLTEATAEEKEVVRGMRLKK